MLKCLDKTRPAERVSARGFVVVALIGIVLLLLSSAGAVLTHAQKVTAGVRGTVSDETGAAIVGAEVTITNTETSLTRTTTTGSDGVYIFPDLPVGQYTVRATQSGFKAGEQIGIALHANDSLTINLALRVGAV